MSTLSHDTRTKAENLSLMLRELHRLGYSDPIIGSILRSELSGRSIIRLHDRLHNQLAMTRRKET